MKHLQIENGTVAVVKETEKAFCLRNADQNESIIAWFPKSALIHKHDIQWANGEIVPRYEIARWFFSKANEAHDVVIGRGL
jgi:hypothetical protein